MLATGILVPEMECLVWVANIEETGRSVTHFFGVEERRRQIVYARNVAVHSLWRVEMLSQRIKWW